MKYFLIFALQKYKKNSAFEEKIIRLKKKLNQIENFFVIRPTLFSFSIVLKM